jgi:hypothetical protein
LLETIADPQKQEQQDENTYICDFEARTIRRSIKCYQGKRARRTLALKTKKRMKM